MQMLDVHVYTDIGNLAFKCLISIFIKYSSISIPIYISDIIVVASLFKNRICDIQIIILNIYVYHLKKSEKIYAFLSVGGPLYCPKGCVAMHRNCYNERR